jgi:nucleoside permease NupC
MSRLTGVLGIVAILLFAYLFSTDRKAIRPRTILVGLSLQFLFAVLVLRVGLGVKVMTVVGDAIDRLLSYSFAGSQFVFGVFGAKMSKFGVVFAFQVLPIIIFIAAFFSILYYYGVMQFIIRQLAKVMMRFMGASGAESMGTTDGLYLALNVAAMLISFLALIALVDGVLDGTHNFLAAHGFRWFPGKLETVLGIIFAPVAWLIGIPWHDCVTIGNLLGTRMVLNELVAYTMLTAQQASLDPRSFTIATFALCGFANIGSIGIVIGGLSSLAPTRRHDLAKLGFKAMIAGTLANLMSASIVGLLIRG